MSNRNSYEAAARSRKAAVIALALKAHLSASDLAAIPSRIEDEPLRECIGRLAKVKTPSVQTMREVIALLSRHPVLPCPSCEDGTDHVGKGTDGWVSVPCDRCDGMGRVVESECAGCDEAIDLEGVAFVDRGALYCGTCAPELIAAERAAEEAETRLRARAWGDLAAAEGA